MTSLSYKQAIDRALDGWVTLKKPTTKAALVKPKRPTQPKPGKHDMKGIKRSEIAGECRHGHRKEGRNLIWKQSRGKLAAGCRICGNEQSRLSQRRKKEAELKLVPGGRMIRGNGHESLPMDRYSMTTLMALYKMGDGEWSIEQIANETKISVASTTTMLGRLRQRRLVTSRMAVERPRTIRSRHSLTEGGFVVANAWIAFREATKKYAPDLRLGEFAW